AGAGPCGSNRNARVLLTTKSSDSLSVVPRKFTPGTVPALPSLFQNVVANVETFRSAGVIVPSAILAPVTAPLSKAEVVTEFTPSFEAVIEPPGTVAASVA